MKNIKVMTNKQNIKEFVRSQKLRQFRHVERMDQKKKKTFCERNNICIVSKDRKIKEAMA